MNDERWEQLKENLKGKFDYEDETFEDLEMDTGEGRVKQGEKEILIVTTPVGKMRLVRESRPRVLEKKFHYSHRQGSAAQTEYKFSDTEKTHKLRVYKWDDKEDSWKELGEDSLAGFI
jgi:hypothetical protein